MYTHALCFSQTCRERDKLVFILNHKNNPQTYISQGLDLGQYINSGTLKLRVVFLWLPGDLARTVFYQIHSVLQQSKIKASYDANHMLFSLFSSTHILVFESQTPHLNSLTPFLHWNPCALLFHKEFWMFSTAQPEKLATAFFPSNY